MLNAYCEERTRKPTSVQAVQGALQPSSIGAVLQGLAQWQPKASRLKGRTGRMEFLTAKPTQTHNGADSTVLATISSHETVFMTEISDISVFISPATTTRAPSGMVVWMCLQSCRHLMIRHVSLVLYIRTALACFEELQDNIRTTLLDANLFILGPCLCVGPNDPHLPNGRMMYSRAQEALAGIASFLSSTVVTMNLIDTQHDTDIQLV